MDNKKFVDREDELKTLEELYKSSKFEFISITGRRRIGKTELAKKFLDKKKGIYLYISLSDDKQLRLHIAKQLNQKLETSLVGEPTWRKIIEELFKYSQDKKLCVVIDEFQRLLNINKAVPSLLQEAIDNYKNSSNMLLCISGSSIGMMDKMFNSSAPLYGRRTAKLNLKAFDYENVRKWLDEDEEETIKKYAVFGGTPKYLEFTENIPILENIGKTFLSSDSLLYDEPETLLSTELDSPEEYLDILKLISMGKETPKEITDQLEIERTSLGYYTKNLSKNLNLIRKTVPITEKVNKSRKTRYKLTDNFFWFWFRFIYPQRDQLELGNRKGVKENIKKEFNTYVGRVFEDVVREILRKKNGKNLLDWKLNQYEKIGPWWGREGEEIDLCGVSKTDTLVGEVKWSEVGKQKARKLLNKLEESKLEKKSQYTIAAKEFSKEAENFLDQNGVIHFSVKDFDKILQR